MLSHFKRISSKNTSVQDSFELSGLYASNSLFSKLDGKLVYAKSSSYFKQNFLNKILNKSDTDSKGCSVYLNENLPDNYIALIERGNCAFDEKIQFALQSKASALLIINDKPNSDVFRIQTLQSKYRFILACALYPGLILIQILIEYPISVVMITFEFGESLKSMLKLSDVLMSIEPINCESDQLVFGHSHKLSSSSILCIFAGIFTLALVLSGMCIVFYLIQKDRIVEERERLAV